MSNNEYTATWDGKSSIEHQIEIHYKDILQLSVGAPEIHQVLEGLRYLMDYRICKRHPRKGGLLVDLDAQACEQLMRSLLSISGEHSLVRHFLAPATIELTADADMAFTLIVDFAYHVPSFLQAMKSMMGMEGGGSGAVLLDVLKSRLMLGERVLRPTTPVVKEAAMVLLKLLGDADFAAMNKPRKHKNYGKASNVVPDQESSTSALCDGRLPSDWYHPLIDDDQICAVKAALEEEQWTRRTFGIDTRSHNNNATLLSESSSGSSTITIFPPPSLYHDQSPERICDMFQSDPIHGLSPTHVATYRHHYGPNTIPEPRPPNPLALLLGQFADFMICILLAASVVSLCVDWPDVGGAVVLVSVVFLNVFVGWWQEWGSLKTLASMRSLQSPQAIVVRGKPDDISNESNHALLPPKSTQNSDPGVRGEPKGVNEGGPESAVDGSSEIVSVDASDLVPGDICKLEEGVMVPADMRLISCTSQFMVNEALLTGESQPILKDPKTLKTGKRTIELHACVGNVFMGTMVVKGMAVGIVVRTGIYSEIGKIGAALLMDRVDSGSSPATPTRTTQITKSKLAQKLEKLTKSLVALAVLLCLIVAVVGLVRGHSLSEMARLSISLAVSVIPEGLLAILTVSITLAIKRLGKKKALVRRMQAIEGLGAVDCIGADKTGTLTEGIMKMQCLWMPLEIIGDVRNSEQSEAGLDSVGVEWQINGYNPLSSDNDRKDCSTAALSTAINIMKYCNNATESLGDATEIAILLGARELESFTGECGDLRVKRLQEFPFDSDRMMMSVVCAVNHNNRAEFGDAEREGRSCMVWVKGATEVILSKCSHYYQKASSSPPNNTMPMTIQVIQLITKKEFSYSNCGLRVLALAQKKLFIPADGENLRDLDFGGELAVEDNLTFVGLVTLMDPPRLGVAESIIQCHCAGIRTCMITGDHVLTATSIARQIGIYDPRHPDRSRVITGKELDLLSTDMLASLKPFPCIFARVSPQHKLLIVHAMQAMQSTVLMTGDGVNDAPAIKQANIGIALGTIQITRDAADICLLNDDFSVIVTAIAEGRQLYKNVCIFLIYLLSCNSAEIWTVMAAMILGWPAPLTPMNILWANVIADIPPSLALCMERWGDERAGLMKESSDQVVNGVLGWQTWFMIAVNGLTMSCLTLLVYHLQPQALDLTVKRTEAFLTLIGLQLSLALFTRHPTQSFLKMGIFGNHWLLFSVAFSWCLLVLGVWWPYFADILELSDKVHAGVWVKMAASLCVLVVFNEAAKWLLRRRL